MTQVAITRVRIGRAQGPADGTRPVDPAAEFAECVRAQLDGPVLRYSQRLALIDQAGRLGVGRFEANLIIASVLHRTGKGQEYEMRPRAKGWVGAVVTVLLLQSAILAGAWWVLH